jgi:hypothetical protein
MAFRKHRAFQSGDYSTDTEFTARRGQASNKPIGTGTRQHLVDADDVVWVSAHTDVEGILANGLHKVLVAANATSLESLRREL